MTVGNLVTVGLLLNPCKVRGFSMEIWHCPLTVNDQTTVIVCRVVNTTVVLTEDCNTKDYWGCCFLLFISVPSRSMSFRIGFVKSVFSRNGYILFGPINTLFENMEM